MHALKAYDVEAYGHSFLTQLIKLSTSRSGQLIPVKEAMVSIEVEIGLDAESV